jgi:hypothetical protein
MNMLALNGLIGAALCLVPVICHAQATIHRWVDERGVVNYGDSPPEGRKTTRIVTVDPVATEKPAEPPAAQAPGSRQDALDRRAVREEIEDAMRRERLAREREAAREAEAARMAARKRCEEQRRVDCDQVGALDDPVYVTPRIVRRHYPIAPVQPPRPAPSEPPALMRKLP